MHVAAELRRRRLVAALLLLTLLPALLAAAAVRYERPDLPPGPPDYDPLPLAKDPVLLALQARELQRSRRAAALAPVLPAPTLVPPTFPEPLPTLVLPARPTPWTLPELEAAAPDAVTTADGAVLLRASVEVPTGAALRIDSATSPEVRLLSSPAGFATVVTRGGSIAVVGTPEQPARILSWDEQAGTPDREPGDGRAFLLAFAGRMDLTAADVGHLGFGTGTSSGVAWRGGPRPDGTQAPAVGDVAGSVLHDNWFGAYTFEAEGMRWTDNAFVDNAAYGFDPHDFSNDFLVEGNVAHGNGRHGFIFSRGCEGNVLRDNVAHDNRGHGFMIDDGRSEDAADAGAARVASDDNVVEGNHAYDNDGSGVAVEGGTGNVVRDNRLERNHVGVRVKDGASVTVAGNTVVDSRLAGIDVMRADGDGGRVEVAGNEVTGGWAGISLATAAAARTDGNAVAGASAPLVVAGERAGDDPLATTVGRFLRWNPVLILWVAILGLPLLFAVRALGGWVASRRRRPVSRAASRAAAP